MGTETDFDYFKMCVQPILLLPNKFKNINNLKAQNLLKEC